MSPQGIVSYKFLKLYISLNDTQTVASCVITSSVQVESFFVLFFLGLELIVCNWINAIGSWRWRALYYYDNLYRLNVNIAVFP